MIDHCQPNPLEEWCTDSHARFYERCGNMNLYQPEQIMIVDVSSILTRLQHFDVLVELIDPAALIELIASEPCIESAKRDAMDNVDDIAGDDEEFRIVAQEQVLGAIEMIYQRFDALQCPCFDIVEPIRPGLLKGTVY